MAFTARASLLLIALAACKAAAGESITRLSDAEIRASVVGQWYDGCTMFEFRSDGFCGYYMVHVKRGSPQVVRRRLSTSGRWHVHDKKLYFNGTA